MHRLVFVYDKGGGLAVAVNVTFTVEQHRPFGGTATCNNELMEIFHENWVEVEVIVSEFVYICVHPGSIDGVKI